jgi:hypothetical protein
MPMQINPSRRGIAIKTGWMILSEILYLNIAIISISNDKNIHTNAPVIKHELIGGKDAPPHSLCISNGIGIGT